MIYLDYASATHSNELIINYYANLAKTDGFLNQEAAHHLGRHNALNIQQTSESFGKFFLGEKESQCAYFHTASDLFSHLFCFFKDEIFLTTHAEHEAVLTHIPKERTQTIKLLANGTLDLVDLGSLLQQYPDAILVIHHVNSETGVIQDLKKIRAVLGKNRLIVDAVQSAGKLEVDFTEFDVDMWAFSTHKLGAPPCAPLIHKVAGFQKYYHQLRKEYKIGRVDSAAIQTALFALMYHYQNVNLHSEKYLQFHERLKTALRNQKISFFSENAVTSPSICSFLMKDIQSAVFLRMLSEEGVMVAAGSACQSESSMPSKTLKAMNVSPSRIWGLLRLSFSEKTTHEEIDLFIDKFHKVMRHY